VFPNFSGNAPVLFKTKLKKEGGKRPAHKKCTLTGAYMIYYLNLCRLISSRTINSIKRSTTKAVYVLRTGERVQLT
jgi:hypothetical protein